MIACLCGSEYLWTLSDDHCIAYFQRHFHINENLENKIGELDIQKKETEKDWLEEVPLLNVCHVSDVLSELKIVFFLVRTSQRTTWDGRRQDMNPGPLRWPNGSPARILQDQCKRAKSNYHLQKNCIVSRHLWEKKSLIIFIRDQKREKKTSTVKI